MTLTQRNEERKEVFGKRTSFYLTYYKEVSARSGHLIQYFDEQIEIITNRQHQ
jgi:hypothetical protein